MKRGSREEEEGGGGGGEGDWISALIMLLALWRSHLLHSFLSFFLCLHCSPCSVLVYFPGTVSCVSSLYSLLQLQSSCHCHPK